MRKEAAPSTIEIISVTLALQRILSMKDAEDLHE
jgi:hypothetical protein